VVDHGCLVGGRGTVSLARFKIADTVWVVDTWRCEFSLLRLQEAKPLRSGGKLRVHIGQFFDRGLADSFGAYASLCAVARASVGSCRSANTFDASC
jgi:hypothetical protein